MDEAASRVRIQAHSARPAAIPAAAENELAVLDAAIPGADALSHAAAQIINGSACCVSPAAAAKCVSAVALPVAANPTAAENVWTGALPVGTLPAVLKMHWLLLCLLHSLQCCPPSLRWLEQFGMQDVVCKLVHRRSCRRWQSASCRDFAQAGVARQGYADQALVAACVTLVIIIIMRALFRSGKHAIKQYHKVGLKGPFTPP